MRIFMRLNELEVGKTAVVTSVGGEGALRQHFLDMGMAFLRQQKHLEIKGKSACFAFAKNISGHISAEGLEPALGIGQIKPAHNFKNTEIHR